MAPPAGLPDSAATAARVSPPRAHYTLGVLVVVYALNYLDRNIFNIVLPSIKADLELSDTALGLVGGLAFVLFYSILAVPIAFLADRYSRRNIIAIGLAFWSVMTAVTGLVANVWQLAVTRFLMGAGEATGIAPSNSMISDLYERAKRPFVLAILNVGTAVGISAGYLIGGWADQYFGWRAAFFLAGIPGILIALLLFLTVREPPRGATEEGTPSLATDTFRNALRFLAGSRAYIFAVIGGCFMAIYLYAALIWSPAFMVRVHDLTSGAVGTYVGLARGPFGLAGLLLGGFLAERLGRRDGRWRAWIPAVGCIMTVPAELLFLLTDDLSLAVVGLALGFFFTSMHIGPLYAIMLNVAKVRMRALSSAIFLFFANLVGQTIGPLGVGAMNDALAASLGGVAIRYSMIAATVFALLAGMFLLLAARFLVADGERALK